MVYQSADQQLHVAYSDDTPPEVGDGKCNQYIRVIHYSETAHQALADVAVGACPGDLRDGMPVVAKSASGKYRMVFESPTPPDPQIVMIESADGGATWGTARTLVAHVNVDGGLTMGCPYLAFDGETVRELLPLVQSTIRNRLLGVSPAGRSTRATSGGRTSSSRCGATGTMTWAISTGEASTSWTGGCTRVFVLEISIFRSVATAGSLRGARRMRPSVVEPCD